MAQVQLDWLPGVRAFVASGRRARVRGLAWLDELPRGCALLIPRCRSVHTFGMRFALDVTFLDGDWTPLHDVRAVPRRRVISDRRAAAVLERRGDAHTTWRTARRRR